MHDEMYHVTWVRPPDKSPYTYTYGVLSRTFVKKPVLNVNLTFLYIPNHGPPRKTNLNSCSINYKTLILILNCICGEKISMGSIGHGLGEKEVTSFLTKLRTKLNVVRTFVRGSSTSACHMIHLIMRNRLV
jgi:hypothetical protein